jgi:hypothetical protein
MPWHGRSVGVLVALGGLAAAYGVTAPGHAQELPVPTVSVPALPVPVPVPVPTVPVPTVPSPPPPLPAPPPPPSEPIPVPSLPPATAPPAPAPVTAPTIVSSAAAPRGGAVSPGASPPPPAEPAASSSSPTFEWSTGSAGASRPTATKRTRRLEAKPQRSGNRVSVRLEFVLPEAKRMFIIVRGPAPSCRIAGVTPFRGRKGENAARFSGRIRGRALDPGVYLLTLSPTRRLKAGAPTEYVRVASPRRTVPLPDRARKPTCTVAQALAGDPTVRFLTREPVLSTAPSAPVARRAPLRPPLVPSPPAITPDDPDGGFGGAIPTPGEIGTAARDSVGEAIAAIAILAVLTLLLLAMLGLVTRFMRGSWNP